MVIKTTYLFFSESAYLLLKGSIDASQGFLLFRHLFFKSMEKLISQNNLSVKNTHKKHSAVTVSYSIIKTRLVRTSPLSLWGSYSLAHTLSAWDGICISLWANLPLCVYHQPYTEKGKMFLKRSLIMFTKRARPLTLSGSALGLDLWMTKLIPKWLRNSFTVMLPSSSFWKHKNEINTQIFIFSKENLSGACTCKRCKGAQTHLP